MKCIDLRCRPPYKTWINEWFYGKSVLDMMVESMGYPGAKSAYERSLDLFFAEMDANGVEKAVAAGRKKFGPRRGYESEVASVDNDTVAALVNDYPDRFIGIISVDLENIDEALEELDTYVNNGVCGGVTLEPGYCRPAKAFSDATLYPIYEKCQKDDICVLLSSGNVYYDLETGDPKHFDRVALDFPELRIMIGHGGVPFAQESFWVALNRKNVYLSPDAYMVNRPGSTDYWMAANYILQDKMAFGTAYPFVSFEGCLDYTKKMMVNETVLEKYLYLNAKKFFKLDN